MKNPPLLSIIITAKNPDDRKLKNLLRSIDSQDFPKDEFETIIVTEGTSESAKAIGIRKAKGDIIGIFASDNVLTYKDTLRSLYFTALFNGASFPAYYEHRWSDNILTRYFALIGGNDPLSFYMKKNDKIPQYKKFSKYCSCNKTIGDNGFFIKRDLIKLTDLNNYFHIDNALETRCCAVPCDISIVHDTGGSFFEFLCKRFHYGKQHAFNPNRRWHLVERKDLWKLLMFIIFSLTIIQPLIISMKGYLKVRDLAWFMHPIMCLGIVFTYAILIIHLTLNSMFQSVSAQLGERKA